MSILQSIKSFFSETSVPHVLQPIAPDRVFFTTPPNNKNSAPALVADQTYLRVWLVGMLLARSRNWFKDYQPAVHATSKLRFADQEVELVRVAAPTKEQFAGGGALMRNYPLLNLVPFRGGTLELDVALLRIKGTDHLGKAIAAVSMFAELVAPPLASALAIAGKVKQGADLLFDQDGEIALAYHNQLGGAGGGNPLAPGYSAVVRADSGPKDWTLLHVRDDALWWGPLDSGRAVIGHEHILIRIEALSTRDDLHHFTDIAKLRDRAIAAYASGDKDEGENAYRAALATIAVHPDLINSDRRAVIQTLRDDIALYRDAPHGAAPPSAAPAAWADLAKTIRPSPDSSPITAEEHASWFAP